MPDNQKEKEEDPFDSLLNLEEHHYSVGYEAGFADGIAQSALEARIFGIEKGFEKFVVMGQLRRQAEVWADKYGASAEEKQAGQHEAASQAAGNGYAEIEDKEEMQTGSAKTARVQAHTGAGTRLQRHIDTLLLLTDPATVDTSNTDDAVGAFDDRVKRAQAKIKVIENIVGEDRSARKLNSAAGNASTDAGSSSTPDIENLKLKPG